MRSNKLATIFEISNYINDFLKIDKIRDYCPNGLQIDASTGNNHQITKIITGVSANMALINIAHNKGADAILVHHGFFWKGEPPCLTGIKGNRIKQLFNNGISLLAYHLPLDIHPQIGNNILLAKELNIEIQGTFCKNGNYDIAIYGKLPQPMSTEEFTHIITSKLNRKPHHISSNKMISTVGICTGAAQDCIEEAAELNLDAFISGEISERTPHLAQELNINYFAAGHHATETFGIKALGEHIQSIFNISVEFINIDNPV